MASIFTSAVKISAGPRAAQRIKVANGFSSQKLVSFFGQRKSFQSARLRISCAAKADTVEKVCEIVKKQLALSDDVSITGQSKFSELGADSLDTVEIVMGLEEAFGISVEEEGAQSIASVQDAADLIENLMEAAK